MAPTTKHYQQFLLFIFLFISFSSISFGQYVLRDIYGNELPTPSWPPPDSTYEHNTLTVWFNRDVINHDFLCWYWHNYRHPQEPIVDGEKKKYGKNKIQIDPFPGLGVGCFPLVPNLFNDSTIYQTLDSLGVVSLCQYSMLSPCEDTLSMTHYGYNIHTPEFWNCYNITFNEDNALSALIALLMKYFGRQIDFAELNGYLKRDSDTLLFNTPNDSCWIEGYQTAYLDNIWGENIVGAWKYEHGKRDVKVAVIDDGVKYQLSDFGGSLGILGCDSCRVINTRSYYFIDPITYIRSWIPSNENSYISPHGTGCGAIIGAISNNKTGISGIAGGFEQNEGVSIFSLKTEMSLKGNENNKISFADAIIFSSTIDTRKYYFSLDTTIENHEKNRKGFGVNLMSISDSDYIKDTLTFPSEILRRAVDYSYKIGISIFASKGNNNANSYKLLADLEYNKIISCGAYSVRKQFRIDSNLWVPTRWFSDNEDSRFSQDGSNFGYGLDLMGFTNNYYYDTLIAKNFTLGLNGNRYIIPKTSGATPQIAAVGALIYSKFKDTTNKFNFKNCESGDCNDTIKYLAPEDIQGLLCISAKDLNFNYYKDSVVSSSDTIGYDAKTGYGMLRGGETLGNMLEPYIFHHYKTSHGFDEEIKQIDPIVILAPYYKCQNIIKPTTIDSNQYRAIMHKVRKRISLIDDLGLELDTARSWGRGGTGTRGAYGSSPTDGEINCISNQSGFCRIIGDAMPNNPDFNYNNIRDISYRTDTITLETYCFEIFNKKENDKYLGWFPCPPDSVVYRFSIWGKRHNPLIVYDTKVKNKLNSFQCNSRITNEAIEMRFFNNPKQSIRISIYNILGKQIYSQEFHNNSNITILKDDINFYTGIYFIEATSGFERCFSIFTNL